MPPAVVLLEFYRERAGRLAILERAQKEGEQLSFEEKAELKKVSALLREPDTAFSIASLLQSGEAEVTSDDPLWERYKKIATSKRVADIPDSWWGEGEAGKKLKEVALAREREREKGA
jgi:hypothetical protein